MPFLSVQEAHNLIIGCFLYAQGNAANDTLIFAWLASAYPHYRLELSSQGELSEKIVATCAEIVPVKRLASDVVCHCPVRNPEAIRQTAMSTLELFKKALAPFASQRQKASDVSKLALGLILGDDRHIGRRPRGATHANGPVSPMADPNLSLVCHYGLLRQKGPLKEYDRMMAEVADYIRSARFAQEQPEARQLLRKVITHHNTCHPDNTVTL